MIFRSLVGGLVVWSSGGFVACTLFNYFPHFLFSLRILQRRPRRLPPLPQPPLKQFIIVPHSSCSLKSKSAVWYCSFVRNGWFVTNGYWKNFDSPQRVENGDFPLDWKSKRKIERVNSIVFPNGTRMSMSLITVLLTPSLSLWCIMSKSNTKHL